MEQTCRIAGSVERCVVMDAPDLVGREQVITDLRGYETRFQYDERGNVTSRLDAAGAEWETEYHADDQPWKERDPLDHETVYAYDDEGNGGPGSRTT